MASLSTTSNLIIFIFMTFGLTFGGSTMDKNETGEVPPTPRPSKQSTPSIMELFKNFNLTEQIPDSAFQRFLVHIGRILVVALVVILWLLIVIQLYVWIGKCIVFLWDTHVKNKNGKEGTEDEEGGKAEVTPIPEVKIDVGKGGDYQKNYLNRTHSMPIVIFK